MPPNKYILKDISLSFFDVAQIGVLWLNGSGKSTFLKIMGGPVLIQILSLKQRHAKW